MKLFNKKMLAAIATVTACAAVFTVTAMAEKLPAELPRATEDEATVSERVDEANNDDNAMSTRYYLLLEPDIIYSAKALPKMGEEGVDLAALALAALSVGTAYLGVSAYAYKSEANR